MKINECVINFKSIGINEIDTEKAIKGFDEKCLIKQWGNEYTLQRIVYNYKKTFSVSISKETAERLINALQLDEQPCSIFMSGTIYRLS